LVAANDPGWQLTPAGYKYNHKYGYGTLDAYKIVHLAKNWTRVNSQITIPIPVQVVDTDIPDNDPKGVTSIIMISEKMVNETKMKNVEQITVTATINHERRGDVKMVLISPNNIQSVLLSGRPYDDSTTGFKNWTAMTVAHWFFIFSF
jgi:kexin